MKNIIITGATSMLGLALIDECIKNETHVTAVVRDGSNKKNLVPNSKLVTIVECDISRIAELNSIKQTYDAFYHFAWEGTQNTDRDNVCTQNQNISYTLEAICLAQALNCKKFVYAGSQAEYGRVEGVIYPEIPVSPESAYGVAKYTAGKLSSILARQIGLDFIWTRIFSIYGIHDNPSTMIMYCITSLLKGVKPVLTPCEQLWDYLNSRDAANALYLLGQKGHASTIYNIGSGTAPPLLEYVQAIRDIINPNLPLGIGERDYAPKQIMHLCPDISALKHDTGFKPMIHFSSGINETIKWQAKGCRI